MKKLLTLIMAAAITLTACFGLTACSGGKVVKDGAKIIVGVTDYAPMDYIDEETGKWTGFDAELAEKVFTNLGYTVEFKEIDWDTKIVTLNAGTIDCIWNGMTVTDELLDNLLLTNVYLQNRQVVVAKTENIDNYTSITDLANKSVAVESGSAAEKAMSGITCTLRKVTNQNAAIMEVAANTSDVAVVDYTLAKEITTSSDSDYYGTLKMKEIGFAAEEFAIAFRKSDSKLCWNVNKELNKLKKDGLISTVTSLAIKYKIADLLVD